MTGYLNGYIIGNVAYNVFMNEFAIFLNGFCVQIEIYHTFTTVFGFVFYHKEFLTVNFIAYSLGGS